MDFLICLAVTILGILLTVELRNKYPQTRFSSLLYFLVFYAAFGLYGIWGQQFLLYVLTPVENPLLMEKISRFLSFLGIPFLVTAWFMLVKFTLDLRGRPISLTATILFFLLNVASIILSMIFLKVFPKESLVKDSNRIFFTSFNLLYFFFSGLNLILFRGFRTKYGGKNPIRVMGWLILGAGIMASIPFLFSGFFWAADLFVTLLFFIGMALPVVFLRRHPLIVINQDQACPSIEPIDFEDFCKRYEISPREAEIIRELCWGCSNQEIADRLFITLQTVKDHLYRIFIKTEVKSRIQLVNRVLSVKANPSGSLS